MRDPLADKVGVGFTVLEITSLLVLLNDYELIKDRYPPTMRKQFKEITKRLGYVVQEAIQ